MVVNSGSRFHDPVGLRGLRDLGSVPERALHVRPLPVAVLLAGDLRRLAACVVRPKAGLLAVVAALFAGADHPALPGTLPVHLLLLPRRVLQGVLGRPAVLRRRRAPRVVSGGALVPAARAERPPPLPLRRADLPLSALARCLAGVLVRRSGHGPGTVRRRRRHDPSRGEPLAAERLHAGLPLAAPPGRRTLRRDPLAAHAHELLVRRLPEPQAHG